MLPNDVKLGISETDQIETDFVMEKNIAISSVENTVKKMHIQSGLNFIYKNKLYRDKQKEMDEPFYE